jgi:hypothetical protein
MPCRRAWPSPRTLAKPTPSLLFVDDVVLDWHDGANPALGKPFPYLPRPNLYPRLNAQVLPALESLKTPRVPDAVVILRANESGHIARLAARRALHSPSHSEARVDGNNNNGSALRSIVAAFPTCAVVHNLLSHPASPLELS